MTKEEMENLQRGDLVRHRAIYSDIYVVTANYGDRITAVRSVDITSPQEWDKITVSDI